MNTGLKVSALLALLVATLIGIAFLVPPVAPKPAADEPEAMWVYLVFACGKPVGIIIHDEPPIWLPAEIIIPSLSPVAIELIDEAVAANRYATLSVNEFCPEKTRI